jgi:hypothetical protein
MLNARDVLEDPSANLLDTQGSQESTSSDAAAGEFPLGAQVDESESQTPGSESEEAPADTSTAEEDDIRQRNADLDAKLTRSRQEIANLKQRMAELDPIIQAGLEAQQSRAGSQPMNQQNAGTQQAPEPKPNVQASQQQFFQQLKTLVHEEVAATWDQKNYENRQMERLYKRANKEIDGFDKMQEHPLYIDLVNSAIYLQNRGSLEPEGDDPTYSAMKHASRQFLASNPKYMEAVKETGKKEAEHKAERKAKANAAGGTSKSAETDIGGERKLSEEEEARVNMLKAFRGGRRSSMLPRAQR